MSWVLRLTEAAERDLREARRWYQAEAPHISPAFHREVREAHRRIAENPWQYPELHRGVRRALVHRFPYSIFYRILGERVQVIAITHQARDPGIWRGRL